VYKIVSIKGYDSATNIKELADDIKEIAKSGKKPVVLALGDFDPSGEDIPRDARDRIRMLSGVDFEFEKIAVTKTHVLTLGLPPAPESQEEIEKLKRDPRYKSYIAKLQSDPELSAFAQRYGGLVRIELDALVSLKPDVFKKILKEAIERHFDWQVYNTVTKQKEEELKKKAEEIKQKSLEELQKLFGSKQ
jgi:5S rRNA maturation endonuclease (ribonuclease M5)